MSTKLRKGIIRGWVASQVAQMGELAIEDIDTHEIERVFCEYPIAMRILRADLRGCQNKVIIWRCNGSGMLNYFKLLRG
jgi:hypothetical protein